MNKDIRLKVTFPNHKKTIKLIHLIGYEGFYSLVHLWCYVAQNHPKGILKDYDKDDLEIAARWSGKRGEFTKAVTKKEIGFVKKTSNSFEINDWEEHNPYVFHAEERSEKARLAAKARWEPSKDAVLSDATSIEVAMPQASASNAPSPSPSPKPMPKKKLAGFEDFYKAYPKKKSKGQAEKTWNKLSPTNDLLKTMLIAIEAAKTSEDWLKDNGKYIPHPSSWLNSKGWEDEIIAAKDCEIIVDGVSRMVTLTEFNEYREANGR